MIPRSFSLTVTTLSLYAVTVDWALEVETSCVDGGGKCDEPLACAATCAQDTATLPLLKLDALLRVVLNPTEFLMIVTSFYMFCVHLVASWTCCSISRSAGWRRTLPTSAIVDSKYGCTIFQGTWLCLPLSTACSWLHASLRYVACSLMCSGPLFTCGHYRRLTRSGRVICNNCLRGHRFLIQNAKFDAFSKICSELVVVSQQVITTFSVA